QKVRVMGIPFNSHFASVMVKADYDMKKIADGTDELNLLWISTLADLQMDEAKKKHIHGYASSETLGGMNRFWFYPGELRFLEDSNAVMIEICKVKLLTEEEHLTSKGDISGTGGSNPIAEKFANDFSDFYPEVADQRPIYQELENLFRFVALAKVIKLKAPHEKVGLSLQYLLEQYPVSEQEVKMSLPGWPHINRYKSQMGSADGKQVSQLWLPSCGGVLMDIEMKPQLFLKDNGKLEEIKEITLKQGPVPPPLFKEINVDSATYCAIVLLNSYGAFTNGHVAIVLGSKKDGYYYYSKNGSDPNSEGVHYKVLSKYYFPQYDKAFEITISKSQFDAMRLEATNDINTPYDLNMNNCADFVHNVLKSGGGNIDPGNTRTLQPKNYFSYIESHNTGKRLW
ncbi:MAG TPA: DUF1598 domain-containing protein, partial [Candidatus Kapabacteria bacterium]|nr:DUF1598 domain-containing protein [Candidatus Kapabacteria bacterium]